MYLRRRLHRALAAAGAASAGYLAIQPVKAKTPERRQQVYVWGRQSAIPGGAAGDVLWPRRIKWPEPFKRSLDVPCQRFEQNPNSWKKISFGPDFGGAIDSTGQPGTRTP